MKTLFRIGLKAWVIIIAAVLLASGGPAIGATASGSAAPNGFATAPPGSSKKKTKRKRKRKKRKKKHKKKNPSKKPEESADTKIRWGQQRKESDKAYDKRFARLLKRIRQDKHGDINGGHFVNGEGETVRLWTYKGHPFIVRSDIDREFTANAAMYMEMLHREYSEAYRKLVGQPADLREKIEVIIFADQKTYMKNGGAPGSGGFFTPVVHLMGDRGPFWPARRYRLQQFTGGITDFSKWPKGTLKHEAAHMELQLRLGNTLFRGMKIGVPVDCPRWWNEGHATVFEYWDFDKTVDENFEEIPNRGRYAPFIRRIHGTDKWKDFHYVWTITAETWGKDMTSAQGYFNYCQAWSLAAYMMSGGKKGRRDFRSIFDLSKRVGADRQTTYQGDHTRAWESQFPIEVQRRIENNWNSWVEKYVSRDKHVPDENYFLKIRMYNPEIIEHLERFSKDDTEEIKKQIKEEEERRKDPNRIEK
ncbi:MAG: hypothetical protein ACE5F9_07200 [Phycisphaerae bacterium]